MTAEHFTSVNRFAEENAYSRELQRQRAQRRARKTTRTARAVTRSRFWGGTGQHWALEIKNGRHADAAIRTCIAEETSDVRELRRALIDLRLHGSFRAAAISREILERA